MPTGNCSRQDDTNWTGAEIKSCCRLASLLDVPLIEASQNVVPVAITAGDKIEALRQWASGRCLSADRGVYSRKEQAGASVRRVVREPGLTKLLGLGSSRSSRIGPGSLMDALGRMSPPHPGHSSRNSSSARAVDLPGTRWEGAIDRAIVTVGGAALA